VYCTLPASLVSVGVETQAADFILCPTLAKDEEHIIAWPQTSGRGFASRGSSSDLSNRTRLKNVNSMTLNSQP
jgi:hypothetical protein